MLEWAREKTFWLNVGYGTLNETQNLEERSMTNKVYGHIVTAPYIVIAVPEVLHFSDMWKDCRENG